METTNRTKADRARWTKALARIKAAASLLDDLGERLDDIDALDDVEEVAEGLVQLLSKNSFVTSGMGACDECLVIEGHGPGCSLDIDETNE